MRSPGQDMPQTDETCILIVDDEPQDIKLLASLLTEKGYQVRAARKTEQAVKSLEDEQVDLILLDVRMPGMSGFEMYETLKRNNLAHQTPVIFLTAADDTQEKIRGLELGAVDYITKPFNLDEVAARIARQLKLKSEYKKARGSGEYQKTGLDQQTRQEICKRLFDYFETEKPYLASDLTLPAIAKAIDISQHNLSEAVNVELRQNIAHIINTHRINHFCDVIRRRPNDPILMLAYQSGFSSKSTFNYWFKAIMEMTPRQFLESLRQ